MEYNWQQLDWPDFRYDLCGINESLLAFLQHSGRVSGMLEGLSDKLSLEATLDFIIAEAIKSSAIEGESLERDQVMSSVRNHLGLNPTIQPVESPIADGAGQLMVAVRTSFQEPLSEAMLHMWHRMLLENTTQLQVGEWRKSGDPMQVVSGRIDRPTIHFEAPPASTVPAEMAGFIDWFNKTAPGATSAILHAPIRAGIAHLYFETIHPFEDGNGRLGRAISEKALSQGLGSPVLLSLSRTIAANRNAYYDALKSAQRSNEITAWLNYFAQTVLQAQCDAEAQVTFIIKKAKFFSIFEKMLNERQAKVIRRVFESGPEGFTGGMNARKYIALTKTSKATATRDLQHLAKIGALTPCGSARATRYELNL